MINLTNFSNASPFMSIQQINKNFIHSTCPDIDNNAFDVKWNKLLSDTKPNAAMHFFRSFVHLYYLDLSTASKNGQFGSVVSGYGDAHLDNFGFIEFKDKEVRYVYNDFDDCGYDPVGLDAVRYFVVLRLLNVEEDTIKVIAKYYSKLVLGDSPVDIDERSTNWQIKGKSIYEKWNPKKKLKKAQDQFQNVCVPSNDPLVDEIRKAFTEEKKLEKFNLLDVRAYDEHQTGGSGGLLRFWANVTGHHDDVIEFKELTKYPGTGYLWSTEPLIKDHIDWCAKSFWSLERYLNFEIKLNDKYFQVRTRVKKSYKAKSDEEKVELWKIQMEIMAAHHYGAWKGIIAKDLKKWLLVNSDFIANRYIAIFKNCQNNLQQPNLSSKM